MSHCESCIPHRYVVVILSFILMLVTVGFRESFAIIITHISGNVTADEDSIFSNCTVPGTDKDLHVDWSVSLGQLVQMAFFLGQLVISLPSGALSAKFSPKWVMGLSLLVTSVLYLVMSSAIRVGIWLVFIIRAVQGIVEAMAVPSMNAIISRWALVEERARLINFAYAGAYLSPAVASFITGVTICKVSWDSIMYITGALGVAWTVVWLLVIKSSPDRVVVGERQPLIGGQNRHLGQNQQRQQVRHPVPWKQIFTSLPVLAIWVASFCRNFIFTMLISEAPQYFKDTFGLSTAKIGVLSAAPHLCMAIFMSFGSVIFDMLVKKRVLSITWTRKLAQVTGYGVQGACMLAIGCLQQGDVHYTVPFILLCVGAAFSAFAISGFQTNPLDLAPEFAGPLTGLARTGMIGAVVCNAIAAGIPGKGTTQLQKEQGWQDMFLIAGAVHLAGVIFYVIFASGERQPWAPPLPPQANVQDAGDNDRVENA